MENILEIKNLNVGFNIEFDYKMQYFNVLNNISLLFKKGKIHTIAGESGCGKSVLINSILNLLSKNAEIKSGKILFKNKDLLKLNKKETEQIRGRKISLIPQDPFMSLNPLYTIENQLLEIPNIKNNSESKDIIRQALKKVKIKNIENVLKSYPYELSGGMKQRVIISMSLISNSELILADEPTTALDVSVSNSILDLLAEFKNEGKTIILITHDLSIVSNYSDTTTIMYLGDIVEHSDTKELFRNPKHPYTKALLNALPNKKGKKLQSIKGHITPITEIISGCKFNPRCNCAMGKCTTERPILKAINNHQISCHLY